MSEAPLLVVRDQDDNACGVVSDILSYPEDVLKIRDAMPKRCSVREWELLYRYCVANVLLMCC